MLAVTGGTTGRNGRDHHLFGASIYPRHWGQTDLKFRNSPLYNLCTSKFWGPTHVAIHGPPNLKDPPNPLKIPLHRQRSPRDKVNFAPRSKLPLPAPRGTDCTGTTSVWASQCGGPRGVRSILHPGLSGLKSPLPAPGALTALELHQCGTVSVGVPEG